MPKLDNCTEFNLLYDLLVYFTAGLAHVGTIPEIMIQAHVQQAKEPYLFITGGCLPSLLPLLPYYSFPISHWQEEQQHL